MTSPLLTIQEAAGLLNVKPSKVRSMIFRKEIPFLKLGRLVRIRRQDLEKWLESSVTEPTQHFRRGAFCGKRNQRSAL